MNFFFIPLLLSFLMPRSALAQAEENWPSAPLKIVVAFAPGGGADSTARILATALQKHVVVPVIVENRIGGSGIVASQYVINSKDGSTIFLNSSGGFAVRPHVTNLPYDPWSRLVPIATVTTVPTVFVGPPKSGVRSLKDFVKHAKSQSGQINFAVAALGTTNHLYGEMLKAKAGFTAVNVPYTGAQQALQAIMKGEADIVNLDVGNVVALSQAGKVVPYAIAAETRSPFLPDVPTTAEEGFPGVIGNNVWGIYAPSTMPRAVQKRLEELIGLALADSAVQRALATQAMVVTPSNGSQLTTSIREEEARLLPLIRQHNIRMD